MTNSNSIHITDTNNKSITIQDIQSLFNLDTNLLQQSIDILQQYVNKPQMNNIQLNKLIDLSSLPKHNNIHNIQHILHQLLSYYVQGGTQLYNSTYTSSMDTPIINISHASNIISLYMNQNMLHPSTSPMALQAENISIDMLCNTYFNNIYDGGQLTSGSTLATLTALWAARKKYNITTIISSSMCHISISKVSDILNLTYIEIECDNTHHMNVDSILEYTNKHNINLSQCAVVFTLGTTIAGSIDDIQNAYKLHEHKVGYIHADLAWGAGLQFSDKYRHRLHGLQYSNSTSISCHKLLFQQKGSALVLFKDWIDMKQYISYSAAYLTFPNTGILGSKNAQGESLLATLYILGQDGLQILIDQCMYIAEQLCQLLCQHSNITIFSQPETGCLLWRVNNASNNDYVTKLTQAKLCSSVILNDIIWCRHTVNNPNADPILIYNRIIEIIS